MSCHVCSRAPNSRLPFYCSTCARGQLYPERVKHASVLLEKEAKRQQIENAVALGDAQRDPTDHVGEFPGTKGTNSGRWAVHSLASQRAKSSARTKALADHIQSLRSEIKDKRLDISQRKARLAQQYSDAESAKYQLVEREASLLSGTQNNARRTEQLWHALHNKTAEARVFLCREAANLYGLRQQVKRRNGELKEAYVLGGVPIIDLRDMNGKFCHPSAINIYGSINTGTGIPSSQISTSLLYSAHLLVIVSHYLSVRLPAEIILPHRNHPTPVIYTPAVSYLTHETTYSPWSSSSSPTVSRTSGSRTNLHRPRPLVLEKSLPKLAKEDPGHYALFLEGATLLAWNVSWLCRTQGLNLSSDSWEEVCDIGKNLWQLLVAPPAQVTTPMRAFTGREVQPKVKGSRDSPRTTVQRTKSFPMLGHFSHGTVHSFLGASEGTEFMRSWRLPTPTKVMDKLRSTLLGEMASAEWEFLDKKEWDDADLESSETYSGRPTISSGSANGPSPETGENGPDRAAYAGTGKPESSRDGRDEQRNAARPKGTSGWTKLKSRRDTPDNVG